MTGMRIQSSSFREQLLTKWANGDSLHLVSLWYYKGDAIWWHIFSVFQLENVKRRKWRSHVDTQSQNSETELVQLHHFVLLHPYLKAETVAGLTGRRLAGAGTVPLVTLYKNTQKTKSSVKSTVLCAHTKLQ